MVKTQIQAHPAKTGPGGRPTGRPGRIPEAGPLQSLNEVERVVGRAIPIAQPVEGLIYRGRLVGYARGRDGQRYAVVDVGRELVAVRTDSAELAAGREVRATVPGEMEDRRRRLIWRLGDDEREQQRERTR